jgi:hypothetical protein
VRTIVDVVVVVDDDDEDEVAAAAVVAAVRGGGPEGGKSDKWVGEEEVRARLAALAAAVGVVV